MRPPQVMWAARGDNVQGKGSPRRANDPSAEIYVPEHAETGDGKVGGAVGDHVRNDNLKLDARERRMEIAWVTKQTDNAEIWRI